MKPSPNSIDLQMIRSLCGLTQIIFSCITTGTCLLQPVRSLSEVERLVLPVLPFARVAVGQQIFADAQVC